MEASDFVMYCLGCSTIIVAIAASVRLIRASRVHNVRTMPLSSQQQLEPITDPNYDRLTSRLQNFQAARFAPPIVRRKPDAGAGSKQRTLVQSSSDQTCNQSQQSRPPQKPGDGGAGGDVIIFPLKTKKKKGTPKEGT